MPGILPMKVIKVGSNAQTRIAQACDRCRSKKIRCDGVRPSCTQCVNVGFECKTSDKLSRRAFPRGYTESLEERVRALEAEVRELKDLLDEKDEKIDMLTRIHSNSPHTPHTTITRSASSQSPVASIENKDEPTDKEDVFKVQQSPLLLDDENCDSYFMGLSSGRTLVDAFKRKVQETGKPCSDIHPETFFHPGPRASISSQNQQGRIVSFKAPPRLVSDQLINIFFQEWAPLFPVLHRPTFLTLYEEYIANPEAMEDKKSLAQLNLVFSIAALSSASRVNQDVDSFEAQWHAAIECILMENSMAALQCLVLAQISCLLSADYPRLLKYKGLAIGLSHRLGLHQSQKRFALGALTAETRKKVFWTLYVVDCFSAAQLGNPRMLKEEDVHCEYPVDADDEYVTEKGFLPTLPGESTKLSSALALFRASRILGKLLTDIYPASTSAELSFRALTSLAEELDSWLENLAPHLRLQFAQDKPSTNVISSRSPLLSLMYHYIRTLIYRPAVCANLGDRASSATLALAGSSKHIVQILQLLEERGLSFTFAVNKNELLLVCGFGLLFQTFDADQEGKLYKDCQRMVAAIVELLDRARAPCGPAFRRIGCHMLAPPQGDKRPTPAPAARHNSEGTMPAPSDTAFRATQKHLKAIAQCFSPAMARFSKSDSSALKEPRRATVPNITPGFGMHGNQSSVSLSSIRSEPAIARSEPTLSPHPQRSSLTPRSKKANLNRQQNLDYLAFDAAAIPAAYQLPASLSAMKSEVSSSDWERLLGSLDNGHTNIYDTIYGGQTADALVDVPPLSASSDSRIAWSPEMWNLGLGLGSTEHFHQGAAPPQSVLSFSDESLTSGEEFPCDFPSVGSDHGLERSYPGIVMPELSPLGGLDGNFGL